MTTGFAIREPVVPDRGVAANPRGAPALDGGVVDSRSRVPCGC